VLDDLIAQIGEGPIKGLLASLDAQMAQVLDTPPSGDAAALSRLAHSLRGAAGALGYSEVTRACRDVETAHRGGEPVSGVFAELQRACRVAREAMERRLAA
jgi:HPt (histidine-containing phosphotransfer) domain-containing protein